MPNKAQKCCCDDLCPNSCLSHGEFHSPCMVSETALFYFIVGEFRLIGAGAGLCAASPPVLTRQPYSCTWEFADELGNTWAYEIHSADDATLTLFIGDYHTIVWKPREWVEEIQNPQCPVMIRNPDGTPRQFSPLCVSQFEYVEYLSNPPDDCQWYRCLCIGAANDCCDSATQRTDGGMPDVLAAEVIHCFGEDAGPLSVVFDLTWDATERRWIGSGVIGNGTLHLELRCNCGLDSGCGSPGFECYLMSYRHTGCGGDISRETAWSTGCQCEPFEVHFELQELGESCCDAGSLSTWQVIVTE